MAKLKWADYSGAPPILLPVNLVGSWRGGYLPTTEENADLDLPEGRFALSTDCNFANPKTDYDRACGLGGIPPIRLLPVGTGHGIVFATELDRLTWWQEQLMLVNGGSLPTAGKLQRVEWSDELVWQTTESDFVLMNAADHGGNPDKRPHFAVKLAPGRYVVQWGQYGWSNNDPSMILFRFVLRGRHST